MNAVPSSSPWGKDVRTGRWEEYLDIKNKSDDYIGSMA
jgi:hypothetical protein